MFESATQGQPQRIVELHEELARARGRELSQAALENLYRKQLIAARETKLFGDSSKKRSHQPSAAA